MQWLRVGAKSVLTPRRRRPNERMDNDEALARLEGGGYYLAVDVPVGCEFGVDTATWRTGEAFAGVKAIPIGLHFITTSTSGDASGMRVGEFIDVDESGRAIVRRWDASLETFASGCGMDEEDAERRARAARETRAFDKNMAFYPKEIEASWNGLSGYITKDVLNRCGVGVGARVVPGDPDEEARDAAASGVVPYFDNVQRAPMFTVDAVSRQPKGKTPAEVSALNMDPSLRLEHALTCFGGDGWRGLLGEFQLAFVLLMGLSSMAALEQWKKLAHVVTFCAESAVFEHPDLYSGFIDAIKAQLVRAGEDFFVDDYSEDSFLRPCLAALMRIDVSRAPEREIIDMDLERKLAEIASKLQNLARDVKKKFDLDLVEEAEDARRAESRAREDEDAPTIVELSEGHYMSMQNDDDTSPIEYSGEDASHRNPTDSDASRMSWMVPP